MVIINFVLEPKKTLAYMIGALAHKIKALVLYRGLFSDGDIVFDIGANVGSRTKVFKQLGAKVVAVEPNPELADGLRKKYKKQIHVVQKAIGGNEGNATLMVNNAHVLSTISQEFRDRTVHRFGKLASQFNHTVDVEVTTIDVLINDYGIPNFVKIDVEGMELDIIKSLTNNQINTISFEFTIPETRYETIDAITHLEALGYKFFNLSIAESMEWITPNKMTATELITLLTHMPELSWGDVYVFKK